MAIREEVLAAFQRGAEDEAAAQATKRKPVFLGTAVAPRDALASRLERAWPSLSDRDRYFIDKTLRGVEVRTGERESSAYPNEPAPPLLLSTAADPEWDEVLRGWTKASGFMKSTVAKLLRE